MLYWAFICLIIALVAALFGFTGIAGASAGTAQVLIIIFLVLFLGAVILAFGIIGHASSVFSRRRKPNEKG